MNKLYILLLALLLTFGCTSMENYSSLEAGEVKEIDHFAVLTFDDPDTWCPPASSRGSDCVCMICKNEVEEWPYSWFYDRSLDGGSCRFMPGCSQDVFSGYDGEKDEYVHYFMIGQGANFAEFSNANIYCNNSLRLAVRWLSSTEGFDYPMPANERAECLLNKNVLPMYILYSEGLAMDVDRAEEIAAEFLDAGPVILVSEMDFEPSDYAQKTRALDQAITMKHACPNCLVAVAPKLNYSYELCEGEPCGYKYTFDFLDYAFADDSDYPHHQEALDSIDLVAVGLNSHHSETCIGAALIQDALEVSEYALKNYEKPSVWAYVLIDEGGYNSAEKGIGTCTWSYSATLKTYADLYEYIPGYVQNGVIGMAHYSYYGVQTGPLQCDSCGMQNIDGATLPQHTYWFSLCQHYYTERGMLPLVFTPSKCADCSFAFNSNLYQLNSFTSGFSPTAEDLKDEVVEPFQIFYTCNGQLITKFPDEIKTVKAASGLHSSPDKCTVYPELDFFADIRDVDPVLTRAVAWSETGMNNDDEGDPNSDQCEISQVASGNWPKTVTDPEGICGTQTASPGKRFHSMGIMQVHVYPYTMWDSYAPSSETQKKAQWCAREEFNPFNREHNACMGTAILMDKLELGKKFVSKNELRLGLTSYEPDSEEYHNMKNAIMIFVSSYYYSGASGIQSKMQGWASDFYDQHGVDDDDCEAGSLSWCCEGGELKDDSCCKHNNFIDYVKKCKYPKLSASDQKRANYGFNILSRYKALLGCGEYNIELQKEAVENYLKEYGEEEPED